MGMAANPLGDNLKAKAQPQGGLKLRAKDDFGLLKSKTPLCKITSRRNNPRPIFNFKQPKTKTSTNKTSFFMTSERSMNPLGASRSIRRGKKSNPKNRRLSTFANSFADDRIPTMDVLDGCEQKDRSHNNIIDIQNIDCQSEPISLLIQNMCSFDMCNQLSQLKCDNKVGSFTGCGINFCEEHAKFIL